MICFPLDNVDYSAEALGAWCSTRTRGVFAADTHYAVTAGRGMAVTVSPGLAWLKMAEHWGVNVYESAAQTLTVNTAHGSLNRLDVVCIRVDKNQNEPQLIIKQGGYSPQPPSIAPPVRNADYDEIYVASILIRAGAVSVSQSDISDLRLNETYCGIMRDGVTGIPTQQLQSQWLSWLDNFTAEAQTYYGNYKNMVVDLYAQFSADMATRGRNADSAYNSFVSRMAAFETSAQADFSGWLTSTQSEFDTWFDSIRDLFSTDALGNLQLQINALQDAIADTGWIASTGTMSGGWTTGSGNNAPMYRRVGKVVYIRGTLVAPSGGPTSSIVMSSFLPAGFRPEKNTHFTLYPNPADTSVLFLYIRTTGGISFEPTQYTVAQNHMFIFEGSFILP